METLLNFLLCWRHTLTHVKDLLLSNSVHPQKCYNEWPCKTQEELFSMKNRVSKTCSYVDYHPLRL